jgi:hypothetical protein
MSQPRETPSTTPPLAEPVMRAQWRWSVYVLLMTLAAGHMVGRILAVNSTNVAKLSESRIEERLKTLRDELTAAGKSADEIEERIAARRSELLEKIGMERPFLSANDRSRWLTIRSLVEEGTYEIDNFFREPRWDTIDMVSHIGRDGERHYYSSKPPLLATLLAGEYWVIHKLTGHTLGTHPYEIGRFMLLSFNVPLMVLMFVLVAKLAEQLGTTDWGRIFVVAAATMATLLTTFAITLNNHIFGAASAAVALYFYVQIARAGEPRGWHFFVCGLAAAFAFTNELPAASLLALLGLLLLVRDWRRTLLWGVPGVLVVMAAYFGTNYIAHDSLRVPYAHRSETDPDDNWYAYTYEKGGRIIESYWQNRQGIDIGEEDPGTYVLHTLIGHHGIFSLTPIWILSMVGLGIWSLKGDRLRRELGLGILALTIVCIVFFLTRPQMDRNYGGMTSGLRWMFWFAPMWLVAMLPVVDWMGRGRAWRAVALVMLAFSVLSVSYPTWNPWVQPWIYNALEHFELL